jgi:hypothetical protein
MQTRRQARRHHAALLAAVSLVVWQWTAASQQVAQSAIGSASVEQLDPRTYEISYESQGGIGEVSIFASASPANMTSSTPAAKTRTSPVRVTLAGGTGRVYFHLKPATGTARVASIRRLPLEGAANFRDLGGYRTTDGRFVRWGRLYRADHLVNLTARDYNYLNGIGIRLVCDLRTRSERTTAPTKWVGASPEFLIAPMLSDAELAAARTPVPLEEFHRRLTEPGSVASTATYERLARTYSDAYKQVLRRLIDGPVPAVPTARGDATGPECTAPSSSRRSVCRGTRWSAITC